MSDFHTTPKRDPGLLIRSMITNGTRHEVLLPILKL